MKILKMMHWLGLIMFTAGVFAYQFTEVTQTINGMVMVSSLIGLGAVSMSPFPIVIFIQWARAQDGER
ncbi:hypothetical protein [uncultured Shewanella sp.]|uniref:hypothetical protein n=1 Tax=uncultured Shewanella sp. TaxID=173975 RepID=UPI00261CBA4B|nr:hypothetical protein [uncultured Shewanella sp.]